MIEPAQNACTFPDTRWSLVMAARDNPDSGRAIQALNELCRCYWPPVYNYARRTGLSPEDAEDRTQSFFAGLLERGVLDTATPERGRLRGYLLAIFKNHLSNVHRHENAGSRGGGQKPLSIDVAMAEQRYQAALSTNENPEVCYERDWALRILSRALRALEAEQFAAGNGKVFKALRGFLDLNRSGPQYHEVCASLGLAPEAARQAVFRLRRQFGSIVREEIAQTLQNPSDEQVNEELINLRAALARSSGGR